MGERYPWCCSARLAVQPVSWTYERRGPFTSAREGKPGRRVSQPSAEALPQSPLAGFWPLASRALARGVALTFLRAGKYQSLAKLEEPVLDVGLTGQAAKGASHARYASRLHRTQPRDASTDRPAARARRAAAQRPGT